MGDLPRIDKVVQYFENRSGCLFCVDRPDIPKPFGDSLKKLFF